MKIIKSSKFVHLHVHSHYSLLDGLAKIDELIEKAKSFGMDALALTDHGVLYGAIEFYQKAIEKGIKPIIGCEFYIAPNGLENKRPKIDDVRYHLILLARNEVGYKNLIKLITIAHLEGFYYKPRIDKKVLKEHSDGLIGLSACVEGEIPSLILSGKLEEAEKAALEYQSILGKGNFYLELQHHPNYPPQQKANEGLINISRKTGIPIVATTDLHYVHKEDAEIHDILLCIQTNRKVSEKNRMNMLDFDLSMRDPQELIEAFSEYPEAIENTYEIAKKCELDIPLGNTKLPKFVVPDGHTEISYLRHLCEKGLKKRYKSDIKDVHRERMEYEISVIEKMGFASYFLIVADFVNWAKNHQIVVGPGRGSAAGSFVSYLLNITNIDPIKYNLLFERFLNPERISMPDIDLDFADTRRDEVLNYVREKYGHDKVAQIITFGTMAARAAVRDAGRALGYPYNFCDKTAKMIPFNLSISESLKVNLEFRKLYETDPAAKKLIDSARRLEGVARHASMHACGVVITPEPVTNFSPLQYVAGDSQNVVTQYSASTKTNYVEKVGLLKMDFLGLKNLTIIQTTINIVKRTRNVDINVDAIPLDDNKTYDLLRKALTTGVFQLESSGMKRYLKKLQPSSFEDIIAMVALYRPGPMDWIPDFIDRKHGRKKIEYIHDKLESILNNTYGIAVYQEQIMQISQVLAGFSLGEADLLRKAMGKKIPELIAEQKQKFISGCVANGVSAEIGEKVFSFIEPFAGYGFNRSHAACYAMIGYQTAYLKAHYPTEFMTALLAAEQNDIDRVATIVEEARAMGIEVLPPSINESFTYFTAIIIEGKKIGKIRFGLEAIKNVGHNVAEAIVEERKKNGPFKDLTDFIERIECKDLNKKSLESLIKSGSMDEFGERNTLLKNIENILSYSKRCQENKLSNQTCLFAITKEKMPPISLEKAEPVDKKEMLSWEKELLGLYVSEHPLKALRCYFSKFSEEISSLDETKVGLSVTVIGIVTAIKRNYLKSAKTMLFINIEDVSGKIEVLIFPKTLERYKDIVQEGEILQIKGRLSDKDAVYKILADEIRLINAKEIKKIKEEYAKFNNNKDIPSTKSKLVIRLSKNASTYTLRKISNIFSALTKGNSKVILEIPSKNHGFLKLETPYTIEYNDDAKKKIFQVAEAESVRIM